MSIRTKAAARAAKYRERRKQPAPQDLAERIAGLRRLISQDVPEDLLRDYLRISDALDEELGRTPRRTRQISELVGSKTRLAEELGVTPKQRRLAGEHPEELLSAAIARSAENARAVMARAWTDLQEEIRLFGRKEDLGGQTRADFIRMIADLRLAQPHLFVAAEIGLPAADLYDRVLALGPLRPPTESPPAH